MTYVDQHSARADVRPDQAWQFISRLGGDDRLYVPRLVWFARGLADRAAGGPGHRIEGTGRPLRPGDPMDFWEVLEVDPPTRLRVRALTRLPGTACLDILVAPSPNTTRGRTGTGIGTGVGTELTMRTSFEPDGFAGHAYWWSNFAAHQATFALMTRRLAAMVSQADEAHQADDSGGVTGG